MSIDLFPLAFYALVCGLLSAFAPPVSLGKRLILGAIVGIVSATVMPLVRGMTPF